MQGSYDPALVALSFFIAALASYTTIELSSRTQTAQLRMRRVWHFAGALAAGTGIWAMHFVGMLAYTLPIPVGFDPSITFYSWCAPVIFSAFALKIVQKQTIRPWEFGLSSVFMGLAIAGMHYIGMFAMRMQPPIVWDPYLVVLSSLIAMGLSGAAIWVLRHLLIERKINTFLLKVYIALLLGTAIWTMHYTGMWAASFPSNSICLSANQLNSEWLPTFVTVPTVLFLVISSVIAYYDRRRIEHETLSETDALTGLKNRRYLQKHLAKTIDQVAKKGNSLHLLYLDLDGFKLINDTLGHEVGDQVLKIVSLRIQECLRDQDQLIRVGGDEFVILINNPEEPKIENILNRMLMTISQPMHVQEHIAQLSGSIGVVHYHEGLPPETFLTQADMAMYHAKRLGRNRWYYYNEDMEAERIAAANIHKGLREAIANNQLKLFYQPKFACGSRKFVGVEALLRWHDPIMGWRLPEQFMPIAEKTGLIGELGEWVLNQTCKQIREWRDQGHHIPVSINISALQIRGEELTGKVISALNRHEIPPGCLTLEITESVALEDPESAMQTFQELEKHGVTVSIDDFGTGYSSLSYLRKFPATEIKIDRTFVEEITQSTEAKELLRSIIVMGHALGMTVVAEGVEDEHTAQLVEELACDVVQGYHFAMPQEPKEVEALFP